MSQHFSVPTRAGGCGVPASLPCFLVHPSDQPARSGPFSPGRICGSLGSVRTSTGNVDLRRGSLGGPDASSASSERAPQDQAFQPLATAPRAPSWTDDVVEVARASPSRKTATTASSFRSLDGRPCGVRDSDHRSYGSVSLASAPMREWVRVSLRCSSDRTWRPESRTYCAPLTLGWKIVRFVIIRCSSVS